MKTYHKDIHATASITDQKDGTARLIIKTLNGMKIHDKTHKNRKSALAAWYRACN